MQETRERRIDPAGLVIAGLLAVLAVVIAWDTSNLTLTSVYGVGPKAMPIIVSIGLAVLAAGNFINGMKGDFPVREEITIQPILRVLGGLAALIAVIGFGGGFIIATTLLFAMTAAGFGRKAFHIDLIIGLVLATIVYLVFSKILALSLPAGPLERLF
ncbi:MAG TPA: tripartite tricarboxylate transporter TctB family protein [Xanthobacteraceae bacterium]|nr:tripartite tricarboxylate transporter TctB family protein [Xanthobacteraceae bacterium]